VLASLRSQSEPPSPHGEGGAGSLEQATRSRLVSLAYLITGSLDVAEDLVQDVMLKLVGADLDRVADLDAYARRAVVNECATWGRTRSRTQRMERQLRAEARRLHVNQADPFGHADLASALIGIPQTHREAIVLRYYLDWTDDQIAEALGCAPATVRSWLSRGLRALRLQLDDTYSTDTPTEIDKGDLP